MLEKAKDLGAAWAPSMGGVGLIFKAVYSCIYHVRYHMLCSMLYILLDHVSHIFHLLYHMLCHMFSHICRLHVPISLHTHIYI